MRTDIGQRLVISPLTTKTHVRSNILRKLDCHDRAALAALADESGLITPGGPDQDARWVGGPVEGGAWTADAGVRARDAR